MFKSNLIAFGGKSKCGKNTFSSLFKELIEQTTNYSVQELSFAANLREELNELTIPNFGVDLFNTNPEDKEIFRPLMVSWAEIRRKQSKGTYYPAQLDKVIDGIKDANTIFTITDCRHAFYEHDESQWTKKRGGIIVHIKKYYKENGSKLYIESNSSEEFHNPLLQAVMDYSVDWPHTTDINIRKKHVLDFIEWFKK